MIRDILLYALLLLSALFLIGTVETMGADFHLIKLDELRIDYRNYAMLNPNARNPLIYPEAPKEGIDVAIESTLLHHFYFNNTIESLTTDGQYRAIGLKSRLGISLSHNIDLGLYHHSQHLMDRQHSYMHKFPVEDAVEIRIYLYKTKEKREPIL